MRLPGAHAENPVDNFRKVYWENSPSVARGTAAERRRMPCENRRADGQKKKPSRSWTSFAAPRTPFRVDAEAPGQATHLHSSANVRQCQGEKETFSLRAGMTALIGPTPARPGLRRPASKPAKRKAPGRAWAKPRGAAKLRGPQPQPQATRPLSHPAGERERGERGGEATTARTGTKERKHRPRQPP